MYGWVWRTLPGGTGVRAGMLAMLALVLVTVLWFAVFPWAATHLPIDGTAYNS